MALVLKDRVKETTLTTGTGSFALAGAVTGYDSFGQIGNGNTTYYAVYLDGGSEWEVGIGTYTAPSTLSRDTVLASSAAGAKVTFSAGQKTIWCDYPAGKAVYTDATGSISQPIVNISGITGHINTVDYVGFDTTYATPLTAGQMGWDGNNSLSFGMDNNIVQEIGFQTYIYGKASSAITKGQLIQKTGAVGSSGVVSFAPTSANLTDSQVIIGIAAENIALNGFGYIVAFGNLRGFNTTGSSVGQTWADGDTLFYNPAGNGTFTNVKPTAPNIKCEVAIITNAGSGSSGSVAVKIINGSNLGGTDANVQLSSPTGGQLLSYDQTNTYWRNTNLAAGTGITVNSATNGVITVTNSAPDQTVSITAGTGISVTGTYPSFTVANTGVLSVSGTTGRITSSGGTTPAIDLASGIVTAGTTGSSTQIPVITVDTYGRVTNVTTASNPQGTVTSVAALTLGTTGTDLSSTVANSTTTPVITLNVPTASATNRGALSSADWTTFNNKANAFTYTTNYIPYGQGTTTPTQSANLTFDGTTQTAPIQRASNGIVTNNKTIATSYTIPSTDNAMSAGPVTINSGVTVTVSSGSRWVVL